MEKVVGFCLIIVLSGGLCLKAEGYNSLEVTSGFFAAVSQSFSFFSTEFPRTYFESVATFDEASHTEHEHNHEHTEEEDDTSDEEDVMDYYSGDFRKEEEEEDDDDNKDEL